MVDLSTLKRGDWITVAVGSRGCQVARVATVAADGKSARVRKWLVRGKRWTARITVYPVQVTGVGCAAHIRPSVAWPEEVKHGR